MSNELLVLIITAVSIAFFHTLFGPDHYVPFAVMAKARSWSYSKTALITFLCGLGHVLSSVVLGLIGIWLGIAVSKLAIFEGVRGNWAGWALTAFGLMYLAYGIRQAYKNKPHTHIHDHGDGHLHTHEHVHTTEHAHIHENKRSAGYTPWALFIIFVLGPCEPLIPLLMYPAAQQNAWGAVMVAIVFSTVTIVTMLTVVTLLTFGVNLIPMKKLERYTHALAGLAILLCGLAIQFGL